jgi:ribosomal protein S27AE
MRKRSKGDFRNYSRIGYHSNRDSKIYKFKKTCICCGKIFIARHSKTIKCGKCDDGR